MSGDPAYEIDGRPASAADFYGVACDPHRNVAVEACAGAGKTWMLVSRIVRALLDGAHPQEILAITFTRRAAGEMRERLHRWLVEFSQLTPEQAAAELGLRGVLAAGRQATPEQIHALQGLHRTVVAAGRPVEIRTFHGWFAALLRNAPLALLEQLDLPADYELLEDEAPAARRVWRRFYAALAADPAARSDFEGLVADHGRFQAGAALESALHKRVEFALADEAGVLEESVQPFGRQFPEFARFDRPEEALQEPGIHAVLQQAAVVLSGATAPTYSACGEELAAALARQDLDQAEAALMTQKGTPRKFSDGIAGIGRVRSAQDALAHLLQVRCQHQAWLHQQRMTRLTRLLLGQYAALKRERGWVDMDDLERAAAHLLADPVAAAWVQERLDQRVRHILIDEFQDTNPLQWRSLRAWLEAYAGAGGGGPAPGIFIVGDPKQSIYRFRRAEPQLFRAAQALLADGLDGRLQSCDHTRRNSQAVLATVNRVMGSAQQSGEFEGFREHTTANASAGRVAALPPIPRPKRASVQAPAEDAPWRDTLATPRDEEEETLRTLESRQAAAWIGSQLRAGVRPGDVMVLARKRDRLVALEDELRRARIATQQPERTDLGQMPEVRDVVALLDALVSPSHDLSLAQALRSPIFGLADADLVPLAVARREVRERMSAQRGSAGSVAALPSWFELLSKSEQESETLRAVKPYLTRWKRWVDALPPHDALAAIFRDGDLVARFAAAAPSALRANVIANLGNLLAAALQVDGGRYLTPYGLIRALKAGGVRAEPVLDADAVKLLTVHGAKGLEAPVVLVLDSDAPPAAERGMGVLCDWPADAEAPRRMVFLIAEKAVPGCSAALLAAEHAALEREELNALYVAMTRAVDTLVLSSVTPARDAGMSWWRRIDAPVIDTAELATGAAATSVTQAVAPFPLLVLPSQRTPSGSIAIEKIADDDTDTARVGRAMHRLLERTAVPPLPLSSHQLAAVAREFALDEQQARRAAEIAGRILGGAAAWAWDPAIVDWHGNEVELVAGAEVFRLDRLVRRADTGDWWVLDYKSGLRPQADDMNARQLHRYAAVLRQLHSGAVVRAALISGAGELIAL